MKAIAVYPGKPNSIHLGELPMPSIDSVPNGRGVLVQVLRVGVDGTDKEINAAQYGAAPPGYDFLVTGHESFGRVVDVGPNVRGLTPGDYVVATVRRPGKSIYDAIGTYDMTTDSTYYERGINLLHGYLTEYYVDDPEYIVKVPAELKPVGVLLEPTSVVEKGIEQAYKIQRRLKLWRPAKAAVVGAGTLGLLATLALRLRGIEVTTFARTEPPTLNSNLAQALGARYFSTTQIGLVQAAESYGPFDIIFEATGASSVVFEAMEALGKNGVLILTGISGGNATVQVPGDHILLGFVLGNKVAFGTVNANRVYFERGVYDMALAAAQYPGWMARLLTHKVQGLENYAEMIRLLTEEKSAIKVFVEIAEQGGVMSIERERLARDGAAWRKWGPYLSERAWGTVREDYSADGDVWNYLPHDHARSRVYRWNEDGLAGISDSHQRLCFALALWNGQDAILKERLFGLSGPQGNHGEDVKEYYFYLDATPTHSYLKMLYKYPQAAFPYQQLVEENARRGKDDLEYELLDTGIFADNRYFDVLVEYAKASPDDILIRISATNRGPEIAPLTLLPTLWFRNTWAWGRDAYEPSIVVEDRVWTTSKIVRSLRAEHRAIGNYSLFCEGADELIFANNETNNERLFHSPSRTPYVKDAFHEYIVCGNRLAINPAVKGTKAAAHYQRQIEPGTSAVLRLRLTANANTPKESPFADFDAIFAQREREADEYYAELQPPGLDADAAGVQRQAFAGMLWSKQYYHYDVDEWLRGDPGEPSPPPPERRNGRDRDWVHLNTGNVISMPDKWEYPWFAAWDLAFQCIPLAMLDPEFAKDQLVLLTREWLLHPNGQVPAYEWEFSDVNPPVLAWATLRVYQIDAEQTGKPDTMFLERVFHKLLLNFTWWVNRKDSEGHNLFQGGFLGLDNIGVFDRSAMLPNGEHIEQSDATSWMGMFSLNMMRIALELSQHDSVYEDIATKFFEHFLYIAGAMNNIADEGISLWDDTEEFFYDVLHMTDGASIPIRVRSMVGLIPLFAVEVIDAASLDRVPEFKKRLEWFLEHRPQLASLVSRWRQPGMEDTRLMALVRGHRMKRLLKRALDPAEFLSDYGVRSLSKYHQAHPFVLDLGGAEHSVDYEPAESRSGLFGGNSNWRGPVWFPLNYLLIESIRRFHRYYGDDFKIECPTGSGAYLTLEQIADELSHRLIRLFLRDDANGGRRPVFGWQDVFQRDPHWRDCILFHEYFHGDNGAGIGASHQTGWTGLVAELIQKS